jgi:hypothetical protein
MDSLGYIFDLINIKQLANKFVVTVKACFLRLFASLKMGSITIDSALQVGFMLRALQASYQAVVQEFCLVQHSLTLAFCQTVVNQCILYDKDPWKGPIHRDGKLSCTPLANVAGTPVDWESSNPYKSLAGKTYNYHFNHWCKAIIANCSKCLLCHDTACNTNHKS